MLVEESLKCKFVSREQPKPCEVTASGEALGISETEFYLNVLDLPSGFRY